jgi:hypothetical protein
MGNTRRRTTENIMADRRDKEREREREREREERERERERERACGCCDIIQCTYKPY